MEINLGVLQLNNEEVAVYRTILVSGQLSKAEIVDGTPLSETQISSTLDTLVEKKLLRVVPGMINRYACLLPLGSTKEQLEQASQDVEVLGRELSTAAQQEIATLQSQLDEATSALKADSDEKIAGLNQAISDLRSSVASSRQSTDNAISSQVSSQQQAVEQTAQTSSQSVTDAAVKFKTEAGGRITSKQESVDRSISTAKSNQETIRTEAGADLQELNLNPLENAKTESIASVSRAMSSGAEQMQTLQGSTEQAINELGPAFNSQVDSLNTTAQEFSNSTSQLVEETKTAVTTQLSQQKETMSGLQTQLSQTTQGLQNQIQTGLDAQASLQQQQQEQLSGIQQQLDQSLDQLQTDLQGSSDSAIGTLNQYLTDSTGKMASHQSAMETTARQLVEEQSTQLKAQLQEQVNQFIQQANTQLDQMLSAFSSKLSSSSAQLMQEREQLQQNTSEVLTTQQQSMKQAFASRLESAKQTHTGSLGAMREQLSQASATYQEQLSSSKTAVDEAVATLGTGFQQGTQALEQWSGSLNQRLDSHLQAQEQLFSETLQQSLSSLREQSAAATAQLTASAQQNFGSLMGQITELDTQISRQIGAAIQQTISSITALHDNLKQRFNTAVDKSRDDYNGLLDTNKTAMHDLITQLDQDTSIIQEDLTASLGDQIEQIKQQLLGTVESSHQQVSQLVESVQTAVNQQIAQSEAIGQQIIQSVNELSSKATGSQIEAVTRTFNNYGNKYSETTGTVSTKITALASILDTIFKLQEDTETPMIQTTHVVGKSSIVQYVTDMISRVKSKMTILVPSISMIDTSKILALPMTSQITIVSHIDEVSDKDWIEQMHGAKANVTLRTLTEQGFGAQLPDFIGGEREGEEIVIGTLDEGNKDYVAIASNSENFVKIFGSQIISEYSRGRSRQLQK